MKKIGRYEVQGSVGAGGMGEVFRVFDPVTRRTVALKVLKFTYPRALHYFKREFRSVARLRHANLVGLHDLHYEDGQYFYTMDLVDGVDLYEFVNGHDRTVLDPQVLLGADRLKRLRDTLVQLLRALAFLHEHRFIHRDIKPSNILVEYGGTVRLIDFGIVKELLPGGEGQSLSQVFGTSTYFSPEQSLGSRVGAATDLYAVGVVIYELLSGRPPFEGEGPEVAVKHRTEMPPSLHQKIPGLPSDLVLVCMELLSKVPQERPSAREALEMLCAPLVGAERDHDLDVIGRRDLRKALHSALEAVRDGETGRLILLEGARGSGKSVLLRSFVQDARLLQASTFSGACTERDHVPLRGIDTVVERVAEAYRKQVARLIRRLPPVERAPLLKAFTFLGELLLESQHGGDDVRLGPALGLHKLLTGLATQRLMVLVIEHLHFADDATLDLLEALQSGRGLPPVLLLVSLRPGAVAPNSRAATFLELADAQRSTSRLVLEPFDAEETADLLEEALGVAVPPSVVAHVQAETRGVPAFVTEMAEALRRYGMEAEPRFEQLVAHRIRKLEHEVQRLLAVVCLCSKPVPGRVLEIASGLDVDALYTALTDLEQAELVQVEVTSAGQSHVVPAHARYMEVARRALGVAQRRLLHERLARAFEAMGGPADALAYHWGEAGQPEEAVAFADREGREAWRRGEHIKAADLFKLALPAQKNPARRVRMRARLADSLAHAGHYLEAAQTLHALGEEAPGEGARWLARKCQLFLMAGDLAGFEYSANAIPASARVPLADLLVPLRPERAMSVLGDADSSAANLIRAQSLAEMGGQTQIESAWRLLEASADESARREPLRRASYAVAKAVVLRALGDTRGAERTLKNATATLLPLLPAHAPTGLRLLLEEAQLALERGQVNDARRAARALLSAARGRGLKGLEARAAVLQARVFLEAGEVAAAGRLLDQAERISPEAPVMTLHGELALVWAHVCLYEGRLSDAEATMRNLRSCERLEPVRSLRTLAQAEHLLWARIWVVRALRVFRGELQGLDAISEALDGARLALAETWPKPLAWLSVIEAVGILVGGAPARAEALMQAALDQNQSFDNAQLQALGHCVVGTSQLAMGGDPSAAQARAMRLLHEVGAAPWPESRVFTDPKFRVS